MAIVRSTGFELKAMEILYKTTKPKENCCQMKFFSWKTPKIFWGFRKDLCVALGHVLNPQTKKLYFCSTRIGIFRLFPLSHLKFASPCSPPGRKKNIRHITSDNIYKYHIAYTNLDSHIHLLNFIKIKLLGL